MEDDHRRERRWFVPHWLVPIRSNPNCRGKKNTVDAAAKKHSASCAGYWCKTDDSTGWAVIENLDKPKKKDFAKDAGVVEAEMVEVIRV
jgi:hypothetical protein